MNKSAAKQAVGTYRLLTSNCAHFVRQIVGDAIMCRTFWGLGRVLVPRLCHASGSTRQSLWVRRDGGRFSEQACNDEACRKHVLDALVTNIGEQHRTRSSCDIQRLRAMAQSNNVTIIVVDVGGSAGHLSIVLHKDGEDWCSFGLVSGDRTGWKIATTQVWGASSYMVSPDPQLTFAIKKEKPIRIVSVFAMNNHTKDQLLKLFRCSRSAWRA